VSLQERLISVLLRIFKAVAYLVSILLVLIVVTGILTQTTYIRNLLRSYLVSTLSVGINGTIHLGTIEGNMIAGFSVDSVRIAQDGRDVFTVRKITCFYEPLSLLRRRVNIDQLIVEGPVATMIRSRDDRWNINSLFRAGDDSAGGPFDWTILVNNLQIRDGKFVVIDWDAAGCCGDAVAQGDR